MDLDTFIEDVKAKTVDIIEGGDAGNQMLPHGVMFCPLSPDDEDVRVDAVVFFQGMFTKVGGDGMPDVSSFNQFDREETKESIKDMLLKYDPKAYSTLNESWKTLIPKGEEDKFITGETAVGDLDYGDAKGQKQDALMMCMVENGEPPRFWMVDIHTIVDDNKRKVGEWEELKDWSLEKSPVWLITKW